MKIKDVLLESSFPSEIADIEISGISCDSRTLAKDELFFIVEGATHDVFSFVKDIEEIPAAFVADIKVKDKASAFIKRRPVIFVENIRATLKRSVDRFFPLTLGVFTFIGVTGTNGKTTTTHLIHHLLSSCGIPNALIGTNCLRIKEHTFPATHTTPDYVALRKFLFRCAQENTHHIVLEVSSHAIAQQRVENIPFSQCIFTNISRDHLDYHRTMENYSAVKKKFFVENRKALRIINADDEMGSALLSSLPDKKISFALCADADYRVGATVLSKDKTTFSLVVPGGASDIALCTHLIGRHNVYNAVAAFISAYSLGISADDITRALANFKGVRGRLQQAKEHVFIDYAHSPDSLKNALSALKEIGYPQVITVFGCGGERDKGKRKMMGQIASNNSFYSIITSDNPRFEDPQTICNQITEGFTHDNYSVVIDRRSAIQQALTLKERYPKSALLIAGKGHEEYQTVGNKKIPFNDAAVVKEL